MTGKRNHEIVVKKDSHFSEIPFNDYVYCIEVPNHTLFVRRNGIACWCGNCSHQIVRHRIASYSQQSQRYVKYDELDWAVDGLPADAVEPVIEASANALTAYKEMLDDGIKAENARRALPNATPTIIYVTMNIRSLMNFFNERLCARAETEIRKVAMAMVAAILNADTISKEEKEIFKTIFVPKCEKFPIHACPERDGCGKYKPLKEFVWRPKAKWETYYANMGGGEECSACGFNSGIKTFKFCPMCGAEMMEG